MKKGNKMSRKTKIVSIDIELEDFEPIHLKLTEAKELYEQLHDLFGDKQRDVEHHYHKPWYHQPYYTWYNSIGAVQCDSVSGSANTLTLSDCDYIGKSTSSVTGMSVAYNSS